MNGDDPVGDAARELARLDDAQFVDAFVESYLLQQFPPVLADVFAHPLLWSRSRAAIGRLMVEADRQDRAGNLDEHRLRWKKIREAARTEKIRLKPLAPPPPVSVNQQAGRLLIDRHPDEWLALQWLAKMQRKRLGFNWLALRHRREFAELRNSIRYSREPVL